MTTTQTSRPRRSLRALAAAAATAAMAAGGLVLASVPAQAAGNGCPPPPASPPTLNTWYDSHGKYRGTRELSREQYKGIQAAIVYETFGPDYRQVETWDLRIGGKPMRLDCERQQEKWIPQRTFELARGPFGHESLPDREMELVGKVDSQSAGEVPATDRVSFANLDIIQLRNAGAQVDLTRLDCQGDFVTWVCHVADHHPVDADRTDVAGMTTVEESEDTLLVAEVRLGKAPATAGGIGAHPVAGPVGVQHHTLLDGWSGHCHHRSQHAAQSDIRQQPRARQPLAQQQGRQQCHPDRVGELERGELAEGDEHHRIEPQVLSGEVKQIALHMQPGAG